MKYMNAGEQHSSGLPVIWLLCKGDKSNLTLYSQTCKSQYVLIHSASLSMGRGGVHFSSCLASHATYGNIVRIAACLSSGLFRYYYRVSHGLGMMLYNNSALAGRWRLGEEAVGWEKVYMKTKFPHEKDGKEQYSLDFFSFFFTHFFPGHCVKLWLV